MLHDVAQDFELDRNFHHRSVPWPSASSLTQHLSSLCRLALPTLTVSATQTETGVRLSPCLQKGASLLRRLLSARLLGFLPKLVGLLGLFEFLQAVLQPVAIG